LLKDEEALAKLSGYLILQYADRVDFAPEGEGWRIRLHFDH
jgi:hypothetical protein